MSEVSPDQGSKRTIVRGKARPIHPAQAESEAAFPPRKKPDAEAAMRQHIKELDNLAGRNRTQFAPRTKPDQEEPSDKP